MVWPRSPASQRQRSARQPAAAPSPPLPSALPQRLVAGCCLAARGCSCWREEGQGSASSLLSYPTPAPVSLPTAEIMFKTTTEWVLLNVDVTGYYQVNYDTDNWKKIQAQLQRDLSVGICHRDPGPCPRPSPRSRPEVTPCVAPSSASRSSIGRKSSMTPLTWPGECHLPPRAQMGSAGKALCREQVRVHNEKP